MLVNLAKFFEHSSAQREVDYLGSIFAKPSIYLKAITPPCRGMSILVANKGVGKSAIVHYLEISSREIDLPVIILTPSEILTDEIESAKSHALFKNKIYAQLLLTISLKMAEKYSGLITAKQNDILQNAIDKGIARPDTVSKLAKFLSPIGEKVANIDFGKLISAKTPNRDQLLASIKDNLASDENIFYLCIDDTDQFANATDSEYLQKVWFAILAISDIGRNFSNVRCIITLRREIWDRITNDNPSKRDQIDHLRNMVIDFQATDEYVKAILDKRLEKASEEEARPKDPYSIYFHGQNIVLPTSIETRSWEDFLVKNSRTRPRDTVQLVQNLIENARACGRDIINQSDINAIHAKYSKERTDDLSSENEDICPMLGDIIRRFKKMNFEIKGNDLLSFIKGLEGIEGGAIKIFSRKLNTRIDDDAIELWHFLRMIGFIFPRVSDNTQARGFKHIQPHTDPNLVCVLRKSEILNMTWDIHPVFRSYLIELKNEDRTRVLPKSMLPTAKGATVKSRRK